MLVLILYVDLELFPGCINDRFEAGKCDLLPDDIGEESQLNTENSWYPNTIRNSRGIGCEETLRMECQYSWWDS